jgi:UDP-N-acetylmuramate dehydrogenase
VLRLKEWKRKINIRGDLRTDEPLSAHTTFRVGGPADLYVVPEDESDLPVIVSAAHKHGLPWFVLGSGANVVVSDAGFRGLVIDMTRLNRMSIQDHALLVADAGTLISDASAFAADHDLEGLEFIYSMPGTVGGAVWMNARCYDGEIAVVLDHVDLVTGDGTGERYLAKRDDFSYKRSPFQARRTIMVRAAFRLREGEGAVLWRAMRGYRKDREEKGHFDAPCAGSVFKNNRSFGIPSGRIIDEAGLRGFRIGGAQVSPRHGNIILNTGSATAADIRNLAEHIQHVVLEKRGFALEPEILFVGDWGGSDERQQH